MSQNQVQPSQLIDLFCKKHNKKKSHMKPVDYYNAALFCFNLGNSQGFMNGQIAALHNVKEGEIFLDDNGEWQRKQKEAVEMNPVETVSDK